MCSNGRKLLWKRNLRSRNRRRKFKKIVLRLVSKANKLNIDRFMLDFFAPNTILVTNSSSLYKNRLPTIIIEH